MMSDDDDLWLEEDVTVRPRGKKGRNGHGSGSGDNTKGSGQAEEDNPFSFSAIIGDSDETKPSSRSGAGKRRNKRSVGSVVDAHTGLVDPTAIDDPFGLDVDEDALPTPNSSAIGRDLEDAMNDIAPPPSKPAKRREQAPSGSRDRAAGNSEAEKPPSKAKKKRAANDQQDNPFSFSTFIRQSSSTSVGSAEPGATSKQAASVAGEGGAGARKQQGGKAAKNPTKKKGDQTDEDNPFSFKTFLKQSTSSMLDEQMLPDVDTLGEDFQVASESPSGEETPSKSSPPSTPSGLVSPEVAPKAASATRQTVIQKMKRVAAERDQAQARCHELEAQLDQAHNTIKQNKDKMKRLERRLELKEKSEAAETAALEQMIQRIEQSLVAANDRAAAAELNVGRLKAENEALQRQNEVLRTRLSGPSVQQSANMCAAQLDSLAKDANSAMRALLAKAAEVEQISAFLRSVTKVEYE